MASETRKVVVHLRATGDASILKQAKFKIAGTDKFVKVIDFLRRQLHRETLFVYVNSAFSPNPDELVLDLYNDYVKRTHLLAVLSKRTFHLLMQLFQNFGIDGKLVVNYACSMAWAVVDGQFGGAVGETAGSSMVPCIQRIA